MTTYNVSNSDQFNAALGSATGGDSIVLAAGNYGSAYLYNKTFSSAVTIKSASSANKAHFDSMQLDGASNLRLEGLDVGHGLASGESNYTYMMRVQNSAAIKMVGMSFHGSLDNNPANDGNGLYIVNSSNVQLMGSSFRDLARGSYLEKNSNITVSANNFQMIRSDGMDVGKIDGIVIDKNVFSNFHPMAGDHADAIQFWQVNQTDGSSNISITNNTVMQGAGVGTQGIWVSDSNAVGYKNVLIQNNLLYGNDQYHGISVDGGHGVQILGNTVLSTHADWKTYWIQLAGGDNFTVKDNVADKILVQPGASGVTLDHNLDLSQTPSAAAQIPNLNAPASPTDLIVANYGYHVPGTQPVSSAPVASVLGQDLSGTVNSGQPTKIPVAQMSSQPAAVTTTHSPSSDAVFSGSGSGSAGSNHGSAQVAQVPVAHISSQPAPATMTNLPAFADVFSGSGSGLGSAMSNHGGAALSGHIPLQQHFDHFAAMA